MQRSVIYCHHVSHLVVCDVPVRLGALRHPVGLGLSSGSGSSLGVGSGLGLGLRLALGLGLGPDPGSGSGLALCVGQCDGSSPTRPQAGTSIPCILTSTPTQPQHKDEMTSPILTDAGKADGTGTDESAAGPPELPCAATTIGVGESLFACYDSSSGDNH